MNTLIAMDRFESTPANLQLMSALRQENITYRGIDLLVRTSWSIDRFERRILDPKRNTNMGGLILTNEENSISRIGSSHSKLIRDELLQALSPEVVDARYCFINLRSLPPLYTQEVNDKCDNCVRFDCQNMDDEALTEAIMQLIKQKQEAFHQLYPALCDKACADLDRHLESLSDERNKHGKYGLWAAFMANRSLTESTATQKLKQYLAAKNPEEALPDFSRDEIKAFGNKQLGPLVTRFNLEGIMPSLNELNQRLSVTHQRWHRK